jgi:hypothetical protein
LLRCSACRAAVNSPYGRVVLSEALYQGNSHSQGYKEIIMITQVPVTQSQIQEAASLINKAIENYATACELTGLGALYYILETLGIQLTDD